MRCKFIFISTLFWLGLSASVQAQEILRVLTWPGYADQDLVKVFEQQHNVKVEVTLIDSDDAMWHHLSGKDKYDVFAVNTAELQRYIDAGISTPINAANIPNITNQLPRFHNLAAIPGLTRKGVVYAIPYTYSEMGLIYARKDFETPPASFSAMWDKRYRGRVLMFQGGIHGFSLAALESGLKNPFNIPKVDFKRVTLHLVDLRRNLLSYYRRPEEATRLFMQNHVALLFANYGTQQLTMLRKAGADIGYVIPKEGALAWLDCWAITRYAQDRKLADAWINYMLEKSVSHTLTKRQGLPNTLENTPGLHTSDKIIWLQRVENIARRTSLWNKIISGDVPERFGAWKN